MTKMYAIDHFNNIPSKYTTWDDKRSVDGRLYQFVAIKERNFPLFQRILRISVACFLAIVSLGLVFFSKSAQELFTKNKTSVCFISDTPIYPKPNPAPVNPNPR